MYLLQSNFKKRLLILFIITIILGVLLVRAGAEISDYYFSGMVDGIIGEYGEYDLLFTLAADKEEIACRQIRSVIDNKLPGMELKEGPRVAGSSNYLLTLQPEYKNEEVYSNIQEYFKDIPGLMSINVISEPRLLVRGFRGSSRQEIRPLIEKIEGIDFMYPGGDGLDIIAESPEQLPRIKEEIKNILNDYHLLEIRYPLNQKARNSEQLRGKIKEQIDNKFNLSQIIDVTGSKDNSRLSLLKNLQEMRSFLLSYASKVVIEGGEKEAREKMEDELIMAGTRGDVELEIIEQENDRITALIRKGEIEGEGSFPVFLPDSGLYLGEGQIINPRRNLARALQTLDEIRPELEGFMKGSQELARQSSLINDNLARLNEGLEGLSSTSQNLNRSLQLWQEEDISRFLEELLFVLQEVGENIGDLDDIKAELVHTSNNLRQAAGLIDEKIVFIPRNNDLYRELEELRSIFIRLAEVMDSNHDLVADRVDNLDPLLDSVSESQEKLQYILELEETLESGLELQEIDEVLTVVRESADIINSRELEEQLTSLQEIMAEVQSGQLPIIVDQLTFIQDSLPQMEEREIIETINLIDSYIAGEVIPGDQIQILIRGDFREQELIAAVKPMVDNPVVNYMVLNAGSLQKNPRGEIFNLLRQVRAVIATLVALIFTLLVMIMDHSLLVSVIRINGGNGYFYGIFSGSLIFSLIYSLGGINFPYLNPVVNLVMGAVIGLVVTLFAGMLNPVSEEEWEAGLALGFSCADLMTEIVIPEGKPGLMYLLNSPTY